MCEALQQCNSEGMPDDNDRKRPRSPALGLPLSEAPADLASIGRAQRDTQQKVSTTLDRVGELRQELTGRINQLDAKVDEIAVSNARMEGQLGVLIDTLDVDREERSMIRVSRVQAVLEVEKTGEVAKITEEVARRADRRQMVIKTLAVVGPIVAALATLLASRC